MSSDNPDNPIEERLKRRVEAIDEWLRKTGSDCKNEQRHCEEGTVERTYWHYGYAVALRDVLNLLGSQPETPIIPVETKH